MNEQVLAGMSVVDDGCKAEKLQEPLRSIAEETGGRSEGCNHPRAHVHSRRVNLHKPASSWYLLFDPIEAPHAGQKSSRLARLTVVLSQTRSDGM